MQNKKQEEKGFAGRQADSLTVDVLVMGAGLAGITAAIWAARTGARTAVASSGPVCSGSSFYPGTWGLGLVGPEDEADQADLAETILRIGEGMADPELVKCLTAGITDGVKELQALGVHLKEAVNKGEKEFIPCFDHKNRDWHGIVKESAGAALQAELKNQKVQELPYTCVTDLLTENGRISGVGAVQKGPEGWRFLTIRCSGVVIAGGGLGGLFSRRLNTADVTGMGQFLALEAGASLVNLEFMQMMPGFLKPAPKTIYNEKVFRYSEFSDTETGRSIFADWTEQERRERMEIRSTHGPFTCRLGSGAVDIRLFEACLDNPEGVRLTYQERLKNNQPEFVRTYFQWLKEEKGLTIDDPVQIGIFAHASNGGILIDSRGNCGVKGLYACGEATGGMHGADRLGGLSTANGLVFGKRAGIQAARQSLSRPDKGCEDSGGTEQKELPEGDIIRRSWIPGAEELIRQIRRINYRSAMIVRREDVLLDALRQLEAIREEGERRRKPLLDFRGNGKTGTGALPEDDPEGASRYRMTRELEGTLRLSEAMLRAILVRKESRGSHYRADFPCQKPEFDRVIQVRKGEKGLELHLQEAAACRTTGWNEDKEAKQTR